MTSLVQVANGAGDVQAVPAGSATLVGFSVTESAIVAGAATVTLRHGNVEQSPAIAHIELAANAWSTTMLPAIQCPNGIFVDRVLGETTLTLYIL